MGDFKWIKNHKELVEEKGRYYPYIMQIMGCPVIQGVLIPKTSLPYLYKEYIEGIFQTVMGICRPKKLVDGTTDYSDKVFPTISKSEFIHSMIWAIADCFFDGCDLDEEQTFAFFDKEERYPLNPNDYWNTEYGMRKLYGKVLVD